MKNIITCYCFFMLIWFLPFLESYANTIDPGNQGRRLATNDSLQISQINIALSLQNVSLKQALEVVGEKSGLNFIYDNEDMPDGIFVSINQQNISLTKALNKILANTPLTFKEYNGSIVIVRKVQVTTGSVEGILEDAKTNEPLIGASAKVIGTSLGATTNVEGRFSIKLSPGNYQLAFSYIGYETSIVRDVKVESGKTTQISHKLKESATQLQDIVVIGNRTLNGNVVQSNEITMVNDIKTSPLIITGISAQQISRSVDQDAGEVARRLPGVAVLNNFVNIRGMHERYNITFLNGMVAPSAEADRRAFSYDLMPSNMIDKMMVYRSPGPELLGDWAGGVIKIETKNTAIARQLEVSLSTWFRPGSNFSNYYKNEGGKRDWLGSDDGSRALPAGFPGVLEIPAGAGDGIDQDNILRDESRFSTDDLAANAALGRQLNNNWNLQKAHSGLDYRAGINYYDSWKLGKMRLNNLTSINTTQSTQIIHQDFKPLVLVNRAGDLGADTQQSQRFYSDTISQVSARWGIVQNLSLFINPNHTIEAKVLFNQMGIDETLIRDGYNGIQSDVTGYERRILYTYKSRSVLSTQINGSHTVGTGHSLKWTAGYAHSGEDVPAQRELLLLPTGNADDPLSPKRLATQGFGGFSNVSSLFYNNSNETNLTYSLDYEKKFPKWFSIKGGFFNEHKNRNLDARLIGVIRQPLNGDINYNEFNADNAYSQEKFLDDGSGTFIYDNTSLSGLFDVSAQLYTGYLASSASFFNKKLTIYTGVRYEGQQLTMTVPGTWGDFYNVTIAKMPVGTPVIDRYIVHWLPSLNVSWNFNDKFLMRVAYGKTINRPNFRELMPLSINDPRLQIRIGGNPGLKDAEIDNTDVRFEYYPEEGEFISLGAFHKNLTNAIEPFINPQGNDQSQAFANTPTATVYGIEAEVRKSLSFLPWARGLSMIANFVLQRSEVSFEEGLLIGAGSANSFSTRIRPLEGTSPYVINAGLFYDLEKSGTKLSAMYNLLGQRLIFAGNPTFPETYELPRHSLDFTVRQRINKFVELRAGVQDILNQPLRRYRDYDRNQRWSADERSKWPFKDYTFQQFRPGSYYMIGVNVTL